MFRRSTSSYSSHNTDRSVREDVFNITDIDLNIWKNAEYHQTSDYVLSHQTEPPLVLRRGYPFKLTVIGRLDLKTYSMEVHMLLADEAQTSLLRRSVNLKVDGKKKFTADEQQWDVYVEEANDRYHILKVQVPFNCQVGEWKCKVRVIADGRVKFVLPAKEKIYILFNPWNEKDQSFFPNTALLQEYVMNTSGVIFVGTHNNASGRHWFFGQFNKDVLPVIEIILRKSKVNRSNAVEVARALTSQVNSSNGGGILEGRWTGNYDGGKAPTSWTGSNEIISQYLRDNRPVRYGQCWVFSGVLTTVLRGLGLPSRSVTNFRSAHDTDSSMTIDYFYDKSGKRIQGPPGRNGDSVWNFHVWNEFWITRPDLPDSYHGWQALDSTPQERSDNLFQCGPCPVLAIKQGMTGIGNDGGFIYAEVNSDIYTWVKDDKANGDFRLAHSNTSSVGRRLLTKSPGSTIPEDITAYYKEKEGSEAERKSMQRARQNVAHDRNNYYVESSEKIVEMKLKDIKSVEIGKPYTIQLNIENLTGNIVTVQGNVDVTSAYYNGRTAGDIINFAFTQYLKPKESKTLPFTVSPDEYMNKLVERCVLYTHVTASVKDHNQFFVASDDYVLNKPTLEIKVIPIEAQVNKERKVTFSFVNPLSEPLTGLELAYSGDGIEGTQSITIKTSVKANQQFQYTATVVPTKRGQLKIIASLNCHEINEIIGYGLINVS